MELQLDTQDQKAASSSPVVLWLYPQRWSSLDRNIPPQRQISTWEDQYARMVFDSPEEEVKFDTEGWGMNRHYEARAR